MSAIKKLEKRLNALRVLDTSFPVYSHEMGSDKFLADLREIVKPDFLALCGPEGGAK